MSGALVVQGDALRLPLPDASIDAICTDPPYGLEFMGKEWDRLGDDPVSRSWDSKGRRENTPQRSPDDPGGRHGVSYKQRNPRCEGCGRAMQGQDNHRFKVCHCAQPKPYMPATYPQRMQEFHYAWAREALRVLKPGGWLLAFGGTRTWHRLTCGIEDAGFELRDQIAEFGPLAWVTGQGFPKGKACLKPAWEPVVVARRPGSSVLQIDAGRIGRGEGDRIEYGVNGDEPSMPTSGIYGQFADRVAYQPNGAGRWPANVVLTHAEGCQPIGTRKVRGSAPMGRPSQGASIAGQVGYDGGWQTHEYQGYADPDGTETIEAWACVEGCPVALLDQQSGERPGASSNSNTATGGWFRQGSNGVGLRPGYADQGGASRFFYTAKADANERVTIDGDSHPTVKPLDLVRWLIRLVTPPGGLVLDMFGGSGTTGEAAMLEGFQAVVIDKDPASCAKAKVRAHPYVRRRVIVTGPEAGPVQGSLL